MRSAHVSSGSVHKSRGSRVVCMCEQMLCGVCFSLAEWHIGSKVKSVRLRRLCEGLI